MEKSSRRVPRLLVESAVGGTVIGLDDRDAHYLANVLRLRAGDEVLVFNGRGNEWLTQVRSLRRNFAQLEVRKATGALPESKLRFVLAQALVKAEAMDMIVQKGTELGVTTICPVSCDHSVIRLSGERLPRKLSHWQKIARGACEQSGRHRMPVISPPLVLAAGLQEWASEHVLIALDRDGGTAFCELPERVTSVAAIVGPEGGFSESERHLLTAAGCKMLRLGPRTLRADTAAIAICSLVQNRWGDLG